MKKLSKILFVLLLVAMLSAILIFATSAAESAPLAGTEGNVCQILDKDGKFVAAYDNPITAIGKATDGQTVQMTADFVDSAVSTCTTKTGNITLDMNGHSITLQYNANNGSTTYQHVNMSAGTHLTVVGNGTINAASSPFMVGNASTLTVDGTQGKLTFVATPGWDYGTKAQTGYNGGSIFKVGTAVTGVLNIYGDIEFSTTTASTVKMIGLRYGATANVGKEGVETTIISKLSKTTQHLFSYDSWGAAATSTSPVYNITNVTVDHKGGYLFESANLSPSKVPADAYAVINVSDSIIKANTTGIEAIGFKSKAVLTMDHVDMDLTTDLNTIYITSGSELTFDYVNLKTNSGAYSSIYFTGAAKANFVATNSNFDMYATGGSYFNFVANSFSRVRISDSVLTGTTLAMFKEGTVNIPTSLVELERVDMNLTHGNFFFQPPTVKATDVKMLSNGYMVNLAFPWIYLDAINPVTYAGWETSNKDLYDLVTEAGGYGLLIGAGCSFTNPTSDYYNRLPVATSGTPGSYKAGANSFSLARGVKIERGTYDQATKSFIGSNGGTIYFTDSPVDVYDHEGAVVGTVYKENASNITIDGASYIIGGSSARDGIYTVMQSPDKSNIYVTYKYHNTPSGSAAYFTFYPSSAAKVLSYTETVEKEDEETGETTTEQLTNYYLNPVSVPLNSQSFYVFEADMMTPTGEYTDQASASSILNMTYQIRSYFVGANNTIDYTSVAPALVMNKKSNGDYVLYLKSQQNAAEIPFDTTPGKWHHISFVIAMDNTVNPDGSYNISKSDLHLFIDGEHVSSLNDAVFAASWDQKSTHNNGGGLDYTCVYETRFNFPIGTGTATSDDATNAEMAFDNYTISRYPASYNPDTADANDVATIAALIKANTFDKEIYKMPYGNTQVVVDGNYFDNLEAGLATVKENSVVDLYTDVLNYVPTVAHTVNTNGFNLSYLSDKFEAEINDGTYTFKEAETLYTVTWYDKDGEVIKSETLASGSAIVAPEYTETVKTGWFMYSYNNLWSTTADSAEASEPATTVTADISYYPVIDIDSVKGYVSLASYSLGLRGHITLYLLLPYEMPENVTELIVSDVTESKPRAGINYGGVLYNEYKVQYIGVSSLGATYTPDLAFTVTLPDGRTKAVTQTFSISAYSYMQAVLADSKNPVEEQKYSDAYTLVADLLQYTELLYLAAGIDDAKFKPLYDQYKHLATDLSTITVDSMTEEQITANVKDLRDYCQSISFNAHTYEPSFNFIFKSPADTNGGVKDIRFSFDGYIADQKTYNYGPTTCDNNANYYCYYYATSTNEAYNYKYAIDAKATAVYNIVEDANGKLSLGAALNKNNEEDQAIIATLTKTEYLFMTQTQNMVAHNFNQDFVVHFTIGGHSESVTEVTGNYNLTTYYNGIASDAANAKFLDFTKAVMAYSKSAVEYRYPDGPVTNE